MLSKQAKKFLSGKAHHLKPVVIIGNKGLTDAVNLEIENALEHHELIKIRISDNDRDVRKAIAAELVNAHHAELVKTIGHIIAIYRERKGE